MDPIFQFLGRLHPMILHAPIGIAIALVSLELLALIRPARLSTTPAWRAPLAWLLAGSAAASVGSGLILHEEGGYPSPAADLHQWLAIAVGVLSLIAAVLLQLRKPRAYAAALVLLTASLIPAGHFGATLTHGETFLTEPFNPRPAFTPPPAPPTPATSLFARTIQPIFDRSCVSCHGTERQKGGLAMHTAQALLAGGDYGPVIVPGDAAASELVRRLHLPDTDDEHMPPKSKPQLSDEEIKSIEDWINAGASTTALLPDALITPSPATPSTIARSGESIPTLPVPAPPPARPDAAALAALTAAFLHVEPASPDSPMLIISAAAVAPTIDDDHAERLFGPLRGFIADLDLSRSRITDRTLSLAAQMPNLSRLNVSATTITDAGIAALSAHPAIEELVLTRTAVTAAIHPSLASIPSLRRVYLWKSGVGIDDAATLRAQLARITFNFGDSSTTPAIETEPAVVLTNAAPAPAATTSATSSPTLTPTNTACPVTGKPLDPAIAIVHNNKVIGFCCKHCLAQFLDDPAKFADKIK